MSQTPDWASPGPGDGNPPAPSMSPPPGAAGPGHAAIPGAGSHPSWTPPPQAPRPGVVPLRPLGLGEILDGAVAYIRRNPRATLGLAALVAVVEGVLNLALIGLSVSTLPSFNESNLSSSSSNSSSLNVGLNLASGIQTTVGLLLQVVATGVLTFVMGQAVLGRSVTARAAWKRVRPLIWRLIGVALLIALIIVGVGVACLLPGILALVAGSGLAGGLLLAVGAIALVPLVIWLGVQFSLASAALVLEQLTVRASLRRSWNLVKGAFWRVLGISLLAELLASVVAGIITIPFALLGGLGSLALGHAADTSLIAGLFGYTLGAAVASVLTLPFRAGVTSLLYIDRRIRREGLDLELARAAGVTATTTAPAPPQQLQAPPPGTQQW